MKYTICFYLCLTCLAFANPIGFEEDFALSQNRRDALKQLVKGTDQYFYYLCLLEQLEGHYDEVEKQIKIWKSAHRHSNLRNEIIDRQALYRYKAYPEASLAHIKNVLRLRFNHQKIPKEKKNTYPVVLDQDKISYQTLKEKALARYRHSTKGFNQNALADLAKDDLDVLRRRSLLSRLYRPSVEGLIDLIIVDLASKDSRGFGSLNIHKQLCLDQLDECLRIKPDLMMNDQFVDHYIKRLQPRDGLKIDRDDQVKKNYLERVWAFVKRLPPKHNSLKAHILFHRLDLDRKLNQRNRERFLEYLKLPRDVFYINKNIYKQREVREARAVLNRSYLSLTHLQKVGRDEALVRDYLQFYLKDLDNQYDFAPYIEAKYLRRVFAESKLIYGRGNASKWLRFLSADEIKRIKERVEIKFSKSNREHYSTSDPVELKLQLKNVKTLLVKIYQINALNYYQQENREIGTSLDLDGLQANDQKEIQYDQAAVIRHHETIALPEIKEAGVYIVECIGNGLSSRALIRKGTHHFHYRNGSAGHVFQVFNESFDPIQKATIYLSGRKFDSDEDGEITIPYSKENHDQSFIIESEPLVSFHRFNHLSEAYQFKANIYLDNEVLIAGQSSKILIRPQLLLNGSEVDLSLLEDVKLRMETVGKDDVRNSKDYTDLKLRADQEYVHSFRVPQNITQISFTLSAKIKNISQAKVNNVSSTTRMNVNGINHQNRVKDIFLRERENGYTLQVLGKNGEVYDGLVLKLRLQHKDFFDRIYETLQTNEQGEIYLGALKGIRKIHAEFEGGVSKAWRIHVQKRNNPGIVYASEGEVIRVAASLLDSEDSVKANFSLLEVRNGVYVHNHIDKVSFKDGFWVMQGLPAGDYEWAKKQSYASTRILVEKGKRSQGQVISKTRILPRRQIQRMHFEKSSIDEDKQTIGIHLKGADKNTRLHVLAYQYVPNINLLHRFNMSYSSDSTLRFPKSLKSAYISGRRIGEEYRYILERRLQKKYPGNLLERPSLLLSPWSTRKTNATIRSAIGGEEYDEVLEMEEDLSMDGEIAFGGRASHSLGAYISTLDFLSQPVHVLSNLKTVDEKLDFSYRSFSEKENVFIVAIRGDEVVIEKVFLPQSQSKNKDLRMASLLDRHKHYSEQKMITALDKGGTYKIKNAAISEAETIDSISKVYDLYKTLTHHPHLNTFHFIKTWNTLEGAKKQETFSKYACHELNVFLYMKDRAFFNKVVLPYIKNKKDKSFIDHWLLKDDLSFYLEPWNFQQLNAVERILLSKRLGKYESSIARDTSDRFEMIPPNQRQFNFLFETALNSRGFEKNDPSQGASGGFMYHQMGNKMRELKRKEYDEAPPQTSIRSITPLDTSGASYLSGEIAENMPAEAKLESNSDHAFYSLVDGQAILNEKDKKGRENLKMFYQKMDKTAEWVDNHYYQMHRHKMNAAYIKVNAFWNDFAKSSWNKPFRSTNFLEAKNNFSEMMLAMAFLDLPFQAGKHSFKYEGQQVSFKASHPAFVFHKKMKETEKNQEKIPFMVSQKFFDLKDRYQKVGHEKIEKYVEDDFIKGRIYGCQLVMSNPTSTRRKVDVLLQIPDGALPVEKGFESKSFNETLNAFSTTKRSYYFYFPKSGQFELYPAQIAHRGEIIAYASDFTFKVLDQAIQENEDSWLYVSQYGKDAQVLAYLDQHNLRDLDLQLIAFRMKDKEFFMKAIKRLEDRQLYHHTLWSYALVHNLEPHLKTWLENSNYVKRVGMKIETNILNKEPVSRHQYEYKEYWPLVHARAHRLGKTRQILNHSLYQQYMQFLKRLRYSKEITSADQVEIVYYLLLQDRIAEAIQWFERINPDQLHTKIQFDYLRAYLAFYEGQIDLAHAIATKYKTYPVDRWKERFAVVLSQIDEINGGTSKGPHGHSRREKQSHLANQESSLDFEIASGKLRMECHQVEELSVHYYPMDIELLFSRKPFVQDNNDQFSIIKAHQLQRFTLDKSKKSFEVEIPKEYLDKNVMIEVKSGAFSLSKAYYPNALSVQIQSNYGWLKVMHEKTLKSLSKVYVKVYAKDRNGGVSFFKDGYTDLRGKFDYTSLNTDTIKQVESFSILILSDQYGALIREVKPPKM